MSSQLLQIRPDSNLFVDAPSGYHSTLSSQPTVTMRASLSATLLLSIFLVACASNRDIPPSKHIAQTGALKVHPGLLGQPVPVELQEPLPLTGGSVALAPGVGKTAPASVALKDKPGKATPSGLPTQRSFYFDYNSADIRVEFSPTLQAHAQYLVANPKSIVRIEGHADERGTPEYNALLSMKRAEGVRQVLIGYGVPEKQIVVKPLGKAHPKVDGHDEASWAENRRADIIYDME